MKIICPRHNGLIDVPDKQMLSSLQYQLKGLIFSCPTCGGEVLITNIQREIIAESIAGYDIHSERDIK